MEPLKIIKITEDHTVSKEFATVLNENFNELKIFMESRERIVTGTANAALNLVKELRKELKNDLKDFESKINSNIDSRINSLEEILEDLIKELKPSSNLLLDDSKKKKE